MTLSNDNLDSRLKGMSAERGAPDRMTLHGVSMRISRTMHCKVRSLVFVVTLACTILLSGASGTNYLRVQVLRSLVVQTPR